MSHEYPNAIHLPSYNNDPEWYMDLHTDTYEKNQGGVNIGIVSDYDNATIGLDRGQALTAVLGIMRAAGINLTEVVEASADPDALNVATETWAKENTWNTDPGPALSPTAAHLAAEIHREVFAARESDPGAIWALPEGVDVWTSVPTVYGRA